MSKERTFATGHCKLRKQILKMKLVDLRYAGDMNKMMRQLSMYFATALRSFK